MRKITQTVDFTVEVPDDTSDEDLAAMTAEIPLDQIQIFGEDSKVPIEGARVTGYTTTIIEDEDGNILSGA